MKSKLEVHKLSKNYGKNSILKDISFTVNDGEFLSILGPSGCGKTTILRLLIGLLPLDEGAIYKDGIDITKLKPSKRGMGIVFQNYALFQNMTVLKNVQYALQIKKNTRANSRETALNIIHQVGLSEHINKRPASLSGGQQQRVAVARTLALNPEIILFDEPMSALDAGTRVQLRDELKNIQERFKSTMIYVTHDQEEAFYLSDRIMVMSDKGEIVQLDSPNNIIKSPANSYVREFVVDNLTKKMNSLYDHLR